MASPGSSEEDSSDPAHAAGLAASLRYILCIRCDACYLKRFGVIILVPGTYRRGVHYKLNELGRRSPHFSGSRPEWSDAHSRRDETCGIVGPATPRTPTKNERGQLMKLTNADIETFRSRRFSSAIICMLLLLSTVSFAQAPGRQQLRGHVPHAVASAHRMSELQAGLHLDLTITLPLRNQAELDALLQDIYNPASPNFRHYLKPDQFTARFGPSESDYQAVISFAEANGLRVTRTFASRAMLLVNGAVADISRAFHVNLYNYQRADGTEFYAPDRDPSLDLDVPVHAVKHLDNANPLRRAALRSALDASGTGSGTNGCFKAADLRAAYVPNVTLDGSGQSVAVIEESDFYDDDITTYLSGNGITTYRNNLKPALGNPVQRVIVETEPIYPDGGAETAVDIEMAAAMAPGLNHVLVYEGNIDADLQQIADKPSVIQVSISYIYPPDDSTLLQLGVEGVSVFESSGDDGYFDGNDSPYLTIVGGTMLTTSGPPISTLLGEAAVWSSESAWWEGAGSWYGSQGAGSSGGFSARYSIPWWQQGVDMSQNGGSTTMRNIPDVAMVAFNICAVIYNGNPIDYGSGTSYATPLWAGFTALVNEQAVQNGMPVLGFPNPSIYAIAKGPNYEKDFHDISSGCTASYCAVTGYDLVTGWGTPTQNLINDLASLPVMVSVSPAGPVSLLSGGSQSFTATVAPAGGNTAVTWSISPSGVGTISPTGLYTAPSNITAQQTVTVTACSAAAPSRCGSALVSLVPPVIISPATVVLHSGQSQTFTVTVPGGGSSAIGSWTLSPAGGNLGVIAPNGQMATYTAPTGFTTQQTVTLTACLASNSNQCGAATVTLSPVTLTVSPTSARLYFGQQQTFTATVSNTSNTAIETWILNPSPYTSGYPRLQWVSSGGQQVIYTAPSDIETQQTISLQVCSAADITACATATITLLPVIVTVSPATATLFANQLQVFTATVIYPVGNATIGSWTMNPPVGTLNAIPSLMQATYEVPSGITAPQTVTLKACSTAAPSRCGTATVTLMPQVLLTPSTATLYAGGCQAFTVTLPNGGNSAIGNWTLSPPLGTLQWNAPQGQQVTYCAPSSITTQQTVTLTACLASNSTLCGTATVDLEPRFIPMTATLYAVQPPQSQLFQANVPSGRSIFDWTLSGAGSLQPNITGGSAIVPILGTATYTAPSTITSQQTVTLSAYTSATPSPATLWGTATVMVIPVTVTISPTTATLYINQQLEFTASANYPSNAAVTWSASAGTITQSGLYTAPAAIAAQQTVTVTACSVAAPYSCATASVTLMPVTVTVSPATAMMAAGQAQAFVATVTYPGGNATIGSWTMNPSLGSLSVIPTGMQATYYAPSSVATSPQTITLTACSAAAPSQCGSATVTVWNQPTCTLTALPSTTKYGGSSTLSWTTTNATSTGIGNGIGPVTPVSSGSVTLTNLTATTTYTMTAVNPAASGSCQAKVTVSPVSVSVSPASASLVAGQTQQFTATVSGAVNTAVTWSASAPNGLYTAPASITTQQTVTVTACSAVVPSSCGTATVTLMAPPVISPSSAALSPSGSQTFTVTVPGGGNSAVGSWTLSPSVGTLQWNVPLGQQVTYYAPSSITTQQTVTLKACLVSNSSLCGTATVTLMPPPPPPPTCSLTVSPSLVSKGGSATLTWSTTNATSASINNGIGSVSPVSSGSKGISNAQATTTYTMTASNSGGSANCSATLNVCPVPLLPSGYCP